MSDQDIGIRDDVREIKADVKAIYAILHGNGRCGLVSQLAVIEGRVKQLESSKSSASDRVWVIVALVVAALLSWAVASWKAGRTTADVDAPQAKTARMERANHETALGLAEIAGGAAEEP